jgi:hypothetical protein
MGPVQKGSGVMAPEIRSFNKKFQRESEIRLYLKMKHVTKCVQSVRL